MTPQPTRDREIKDRVVRGVAWVAVGNWGQRLTTFGVFLVLARLLDLEAFGLVAIASSFIFLIRIFQDQGLPHALIQRDGLESSHMDTAFWINLAFGGLLTALCAVASGGIARLYGQPQLGAVIRCLSPTFLLVSLGSTHDALLQRDMEFRRLTQCLLVARLSAGAVAVAMAFAGLGVWALVANALVGNAMRTVALWSVSRWRPGMGASWRSFRELIGFGANIVGMNITMFCQLRFSHFLIGYCLGPAAAGLYAVASRLVRLLQTSMAGAADSVLFPAFSRLQGEPERLRQALHRTVHLVSIVVFPVFCGLALVAPELVPAVFGEKWQGGVPVVRVLSLVAVIEATMRFNGNALMAVGKPGWLLRLRIVAAAATVAALLVGVRWGILGVAIGYAAVSGPAGGAILLLAHRAIGHGVKEYLAQYIPAAVATAAMSVTVALLMAILGKSWNPYARLAAYVATAISTYIAVLWFVWPSVVWQFIRVVRTVGSPRTVQPGLLSQEAMDA